MRNWNKRVIRETFWLCASNRTYEELKYIKDKEKWLTNTIFQSYLWGIEMWSWKYQNSSLNSSNRTYEELKSGLVKFPVTHQALPIVPMRNWNSGTLTRYWLNSASNRTYEELKCCRSNSLYCHSPLPIVPMRNWNKWSASVFSIRYVFQSYLWGIEMRYRPGKKDNDTLPIVPMRNWNNIGVYFLFVPHKLPIVPMRNWNILLLIIRTGFDTCFQSYLWGIEINYFLKKKWQELLPIVPMRNWNLIPEHAGVISVSFQSYLWGIEITSELLTSRSLY